MKKLKKFPTPFHHSADFNTPLWVLSLLFARMLQRLNCLSFTPFKAVPRAGLEPARTQCSQDFKSSLYP